MFALNDQVFLLEHSNTLKMDFRWLLFDSYCIMPLSILDMCILQVFRAPSLEQTRMLLSRCYWSQIFVRYYF